MDNSECGRKGARDIELGSGAALCEADRPLVGACHVDSTIEDVASCHDRRLVVVGPIHESDRTFCISASLDPRRSPGCITPSATSGTVTDTCGHLNEGSPAVVVPGDPPRVEMDYAGIKGRRERVSDSITVVLANSWHSDRGEPRL